MYIETEPENFFHKMKRPGTQKNRNFLPLYLIITSYARTPIAITNWRLTVDDKKLCIAVAKST